MSRHLRFITVLLLALTFTIAGCGKKDKNTDTGNEAHLTFIPSDTPYAFVSMQPLPEDLQKKFSESYEGLFKVYGRIASESYQEFIDRSKANKRAEDETGVAINEDEDFWENPWVQAVQKEFDGGFSLAKLNDFGIDKKSLYAFYGNGVLPVLRMSLSDTQLFIDAIERIENNAGDEIPEIKITGMRVWSLSDGPEEHPQFLIAVSESDLILSLAPPKSSTSLIESLLGKTKPENSLATSKTLHKLMQDKAYLPESLGFIDFQQILNRFIQEPTGIDIELLALFEEFSEQRAEISEACKTDLTKVVNTVPRLVYGLTELSKDKLRTESVFEVREDLAKEMTELTAPVPGLGKAAGLFSMGFSMDIPAMRDFAIRRIEGLKANPYECEFMQSDEKDLDKMLAAVKNPAAGFVESVHGMNIVVDDIDVAAFKELIEAEEMSEEEMDFNEIQELLTEKFSAFAVLAADKPKTMINMGKMFSPELASLDIKPNGKAILINELFPEPIPFDVFAAMNDKALTFSMGKNAKTNSEKILDLETSKSQPLISYSIDMNKYMEIFSALMENPKFAEEFESSEELTVEELKSVLNAFFGIAGKASFNMTLRSDGVAFEQDLELN